MDYLAARGIFYWRSQPTPVPIRRGREILGIRRIPAAQRGMPDIMGLYKGSLIAIEVKSDIGRQTDDQKHWQTLLEANGALYTVARSWQDVQVFLKIADSQAGTA